ncbi:MAG: hypothetical protein V2I36_02195 [Desulfopila sp.]|jgi:hypothetical protein|nr:hypothetical protein [Desulfopila sp.]
MKKTFMILLLCIVPAFSCMAGENPWESKLPFKEATIEYSISGMEKGNETVYIRDYGRETATYRSSVMSMMGMKQATETIEFMDPDWIYSFDLQEGTGTKAANPQKYMIEEYNKLSTSEKQQVIKNSEQMSGGPLFGGMSADIEKNAATILGYDCDRVSLMGATVYTIPKSGVALKTESNMMGMKILIEATKIDEGSAPEKFFQHPEGITPIMDPEADAMARTMAQETMKMLKDPDAAEKAKNSPMMLPGAQQQDMTPEEQQEMQEAMEMLKGLFGN